MCDEVRIMSRKLPALVVGLAMAFTAGAYAADDPPAESTKHGARDAFP